MIILKATSSKHYITHDAYASLRDTTSLRDKMLDMGVVIVKDREIHKKDIKIAREEYPNYIKLTIDISQNIVALGGQYHVDAEQILIQEYSSRQRDIWGGGYEIDTKNYRTDAMVNLRPFLDNQSMIIRDPEIEAKFLKISKNLLKDIESFI